jgi:hypothetical protein
MITILHNTIDTKIKQTKMESLICREFDQEMDTSCFILNLFMRPNKIGQGNGHKLRKISSLNHMKKNYP